jgi:DNA-binding NarL/FixJ family response regulator
MSLQEFCELDSLRELDSLPEVTPIRVLLADDHPVMLSGLRRLIEGFEDLEVVGVASSGGELLRHVSVRAPDVVLTDLRMPGAEGTSVLERIREQSPDVKVVVLSACDDRSSIDSALQAGVAAYIIKSAAPADIASVIRQAHRGTVFHAPSGSRSTSEPAEATPCDALTVREREVLGAVADGGTTAEISKNLWLSEHTIKFHLTNIYRKLGVSNRAGAVRYAMEMGIHA